MGVKVAGGIRTSKDAIRYLVLVNETVGSAWLTRRALPLRRVVAAQRPPDAAAPSSVAAPTCAPTNSAGTDVAGELTTSTLGSMAYDAAPESASIARLQPSYGLFIDGEFSDPSSHEQFASLNPATEETLATVAQASPADVDRAVAAARRAYDDVWSKTTGARAREVPVPHRAPDPGTLPRTRGRRDARQRQAHPRVARRRHPPGRGALLLLRRAGPTSSSTPGSGPPRVPWAWPARSSRGTSRC